MSEGTGAAAPEMRRALQLFNQARLGAWWTALWGRLTGRGTTLQELAGGAAGAEGSGHYAGIRAVALGQVRGSEGRAHDFDGAFHPLNDNTRQRWLRVAVARLQGVPLPPVELLQVGDRYYVRDGHHRISVARALGEESLDAEVIVQMAG